MNFIIKNKIMKQFVLWMTKFVKPMTVDSVYKRNYSFSSFSLVWFNEFSFTIVLTATLYKGHAIQFPPLDIFL